MRNVLSVDGPSVAGSERRLRLRQLRDDNRGVNLGSIDGSVNYPTVALQYLDPAFPPRFTFTTARRARLGGVETTMVGFVEQRRTSIARNGMGGRRQTRS